MPRIITHRQNQYLELVDSIAYWTPAIALPRETVRKCKELIDSDKTVRPYAILLFSYLLLKAGKTFRQEHNECFGQLKQLAQSRLKESAAARWILARIYANDAAAEKDERKRYCLLHEAFLQVVAINEVVSLRLPVLLPGIKSEAAPHLLKGDNGVSDPTVDAVVAPYRYISAYLMSYAYDHARIDHNKSLELIASAKQYCILSKQKNGISHPFLSQNIAQLSSVIDTILSCRGKTEIKKGQVIDEFLLHLQNIDRSISNFELTESKGCEWKAGCNAAIAALSTDSEQRHSHHLRLFHHQAKHLVQLTNGKTDFFNIDIVYKLAHFNKEEEDEFKKSIACVPSNSSSPSGVSSTSNSSYEEALKRAQWMKDFIENGDGYKIFYVEGQPVKKEVILHKLYTCCWYDGSHDVNREVNNGRGPVDFVISNGRDDKTVVEFKLASNSKMKSNLANQVEIYKKASRTPHSVTVIMYFTRQEFNRTQRILRDLGLDSAKDIILIDAEPKVSASNAK